MFKLTKDFNFWLTIISRTYAKNGINVDKYNIKSLYIKDDEYPERFQRRIMN